MKTADSDGKSRRAGIGFQGGQVLALRMDDPQLTALRKQLQTAKGGWYEVEVIDGAVLVDLAQVVYVRVESDESRVGF